MNQSHFDQQILQKIENSFEFKVLVLGERGVGKTSLIQTLVAGYADVVDDGSSESMMNPTDLLKSCEQELWKHRIKLSEDDLIPMQIVSKTIVEPHSLISNHLS